MAPYPPGRVVSSEAGDAASLYIFWTGFAGELTLVPGFVTHGAMKILARTPVLRTHACGAVVMTHTRKTPRRRSIDAGERPSARIDENEGVSST